MDSNHMVSVGDEGFFCISGPDVDWEGERGCYYGIDTEEFHLIDTIDYMTFHLYPDHWNKDPVTWGLNGLKITLQLLRSHGL
eukprot:TRINITY_DN16166_c0_g1_i1.p1 TRINITY_DN16166_c0_g1~~TRINITY_DN16166_c0_g1_i1.p1  ORF type:complete len:94 (+),score=13.47 TRINITY_DN16166_c0_g1_i1:38-283(+)